MLTGRPSGYSAAAAVARERPAMRALVVEPAAAIGRVLRQLLERLGFDVCVVTGPEEAVTIADSQQDFQVLITELWLPGISGRALAGFMRQRMPGARILYLCDEMARSEIEAQGEAALVKPFSPPQLSGVLARLLAGSSA